LGLEIQPEEDLLNAIFTDTISLQTTTVVRDSVQTSDAGAILVGSYKDDYFGRVTAEGYTEMTLRTTNLTYPKGFTRTLDSVVLLLDYEYYYGDTTKEQTFSVYPLLDSVPTTTRYATDKQPYDLTQPWGSKTFKINPRRKGSSKRYLRLRLNSVVGDKLLSSDTVRGSRFRAFMKGMAIVPDTTNNTAVFGFNFSGDSSRVELHFQTRDVNMVSQDTLKYVFNAGAGYYYSNIRANRSNTLLAGLSAKDTLPTRLTQNLAFIQSGTGVRSLIKFPNIIKQTAALGNIKIVKAELELVSQKVTTATPPPSGLYMSQATSEGKVPTTISNGVKQEVYVAQSSTSTQPQVYQADSSSKGYVYTIPVTNYISNIVKDKLPNNGLILTSASNRFATTRLIFGDRKNAVNPIRLKLYYIKLN
jgi:hypothetical protein